MRGEQIARGGVHGARGRKQVGDRDADADGETVLLDGAGVERTGLRRERSSRR